MSKDSDKAPAQHEIHHRGVVGVYRSKRQIFSANLIGGIAWGIGSVLGATIFIATILSLLTALGGLPIIGSYITDIANAISDGMSR